MTSPITHHPGQSPPKEPISLGNNIFLYQPSQRRQSQHQPTTEEVFVPLPSPPSLIILCTWLGGATTRRVDKYVSGYRDQYPGASILLVRTIFLDIAVRSFAALRAQLKPARDAIITLLEQEGDDENKRQDGQRKKDILLHIFSHGGCNMAIQLAISMDQQAGSLLRDRLRLVIFDCCPGDASFGKAYNAAMLSLPQQFPRMLGTPLVYGAVSVIYGLQSAGLMPSVREMRCILNDLELFGGRTDRLYLLSRDDRMVRVEDALSHARLARKLGYRVGTVLFEKAAHCALVMEDAEKYWSAIRNSLWGKGLPQQPRQAQTDLLLKL
ncbi:hypothetical protein DL767_008076 [Monosporascus sp. MG133]|nr:hypothetical protein DL767_008076 [Monosporascus sp. MG133]